jgi:hypothetical protein
MLQHSIIKNQIAFGFYYWGAVVEDVRTVFERMDDATIYIPSFYPTAEYTI